MQSFIYVDKNTSNEEESLWPAQGIILVIYPRPRHVSNLITQISLQKT